MKQFKRWVIGIVLAAALHAGKVAYSSNAEATKVAANGTGFYASASESRDKSTYSWQKFAGPYNAKVRYEKTKNHEKYMGSCAWKAKGLESLVFTYNTHSSSIESVRSVHLRTNLGHHLQEISFRMSGSNCSWYWAPINI